MKMRGSGMLEPIIKEMNKCIDQIKEMNKCMDQIKDNLHDIKEKIDNLKGDKK